MIHICITYENYQFLLGLRLILQGTNSPLKALLKMIPLFPRVGYRQIYDMD